MLKTPVQISAEEHARQVLAVSEAKEIVRDLADTLHRIPKACVVTFGCQMNARDSEKLAGVLSEIGYCLIDEEDGADFVVFNTCTVRENADNRLLGRLGRLSSFKKERPHMKIAVCGCMMQEEGAVKRLTESYRHVDLIFGTFNLHRFAELIVTAMRSDRVVIDIWKEAGEVTEDLPVIRKYPFKSGVNIMYGCDNFCSFCIVPYVRGRERSRTASDILDEVKRLASEGVKEVMLLGQNVNSYGQGLTDETDFPALLRKVAAVDGIGRIRFMSSHPKDFSDALIEVIREEKKIARHVHLALQSGSDRILKLMNRHYTKAQFLELCDRIRERAPEVAITTDIIVGFPTETDEDADETLDVIRRVQFDNAFTFVYSKRTHTKAATIEEALSPEEVAKRTRDNFDRILKEVQTQAKAQSGKYTGLTETVLVEGVNAQDPLLLTGRLSNNTLVHFPGDAQLTGTFCDVTLDHCLGFYYLGHKI